MPSPSNLSEQVLALPTGAGSMEPAGQPFQVNAATGTGTYAVAIELRPGHAGLTPSLSLVYSTHAGSGIAGVGWSLGMPRVDRRLDKGLPSYDDSADCFTLHGDELLPEGEGQYRYRIETRFARVRHVKGAGQNYWTVTERDGTRLLYGLLPDHRLHDDSGRIASWHLSRKQDVSGNEVTFDYQRDVETRDVRLSAIEWAGCYRVRFVYELRPDPIRSFRSGFEHAALHRLTAIHLDVRKTTDLSFHTYKRYLLAYKESPLTGRSLLASVGTNGIAADAASRELPRVSFTYSTGRVESARLVSVTGSVPGRSLKEKDVTLVRQSGSGLPDVLETTANGHWLRENRGNGEFGAPRRVSSPAEVSLAQRGTFISDMDGDGWGDLAVNGGASVYGGVPGGGWGTPYVSTLAPAADLEGANLRIADLSGDGIPDALRSGAGGLTFYRNFGKGKWAPAVRVAGQMPFQLDDARVHLADINGDGLPDLVYMERSRVRIWPGKGLGEFGAPYQLDNAPDFGSTFDPAGVRWIDLTGSGQADLLYTRPAVVVVCFNCAGASLSDPVVLPSTPQSSYGHVEPVDLLGSGAEGLLFTDRPNRNSSWRYLELFPGGTPDLLTTVENGLGGVTTIEYTSSATFWVADKRSRRPWKTAMPSAQRVVASVTNFDSITGVRSGLLYRYHHGVYDGVEREFRGFAMVEQFEREADRGDPLPVAPVMIRRWFHTGFDVDLRSEYYPLADGSLTDEVPRIPWALRSMRGLMRREEVFALDGNPKPFAVVETAYRVFPVGRSPGTDRRSFAALPVRTRSTQLERSAERRVVERSTVYDLHFGGGYGLPVEVHEAGCGRSGAFTAPEELQQAQNLRRVTTLEYVHRDLPENPRPSPYAAAYIVGKLSRKEEHGDALLSRELLFYDGEPFAGLGYPGSGSDPGVVRGRLSSKIRLAFQPQVLKSVYPATATAEWTARGNYLALDGALYLHGERHAYNERGMITTSRDANGNEVRFENDDAFGLFPVRVVNAAGEPLRISRAVLPFQLDSIIDANGNRTEYRYDPTGLPAAKSVMGKQASGVWEGDPPEYPTEEYLYDFNSRPMAVTIKRRQEREAATFDIVRYLDGLGRPIQERRTAEPDPVSGEARFRVTGWQLLNHKGLVVRSYKPYFAPTAAFARGDTATAFVQTSYDALGRPVRIDHPDGTVETTAYGAWVHTFADRNDNGGHLGTADPRYGPYLDGFSGHVGTPARTYVDAFGREMATAADNGDAVHVTRSVLDLNNRLIEFWDARKLEAPTWRFTYDGAGRRIRSDHATGLGERLYLPDAAGNLIWRRDAAGVETVQTFDSLNRAVEELSTFDGDVKLRRTNAYPKYDESNPNFADRQRRNLFGNLVEARDADGVRWFDYDWRGLITRLVSRFWNQDDAQGRRWTDAASELWTNALSWDPGIPRDEPSSWLELPGLSSNPEIVVEASYDSATRKSEARYPEGLRTRFVYNAGSFLSRIELDAGDGTGYSPVVAELRYNARAQLEAVVCGNGVETKRQYDPVLERLTRLVTHHPGSGTVFQDRTYHYDPAGNVVEIRDGLEQTTTPGLTPNTRTFRYDPRYRLTGATGSRHVDSGGKDGDVLEPFPNPAMYEPYDFEYAYDECGNFTLNHEYSDQPLMYRAGRMDLFAGDAGDAGAFEYDANGSTVRTPRLQRVSYAHDGQVRSLETNRGALVHSFAHGDACTVRLMRQGENVQLRIQMDPLEYECCRGAVSHDKLTLHVTGAWTHAQIGRLLAGSDPSAPDLFFEHPDHLKSAQLLTARNGSFLSQEEFFPYGGSSDRRAAFNRFRFLGEERDEVSGLMMTGPRSYDPVIGRFLQGDRVAVLHPDTSPYCYASARPIIAADPSGYLPETVPDLSGDPNTPGLPGAGLPAGSPPGPDAAVLLHPADIKIDFRYAPKSELTLTPRGSVWVQEPHPLPVSPDQRQALRAVVQQEGSYWKHITDAEAGDADKFWVSYGDTHDCMASAAKSAERMGFTLNLNARTAVPAPGEVVKAGGLARLTVAQNQRILNFIDEQLWKGHPVGVWVDYAPGVGKGAADGATDHVVLVYARDYVSGTVVYRYIENAGSDHPTGYFNVDATTYRLYKQAPPYTGGDAYTSQLPFITAVGARPTTLTK